MLCVIVPLFYLFVTGQVPKNFRKKGRRNPPSPEEEEEDDGNPLEGQEGGEEGSGDEDTLNVKTPAVLAAEAIREAERVAAEAVKKLEQLQRKTLEDSLARRDSEAAALREENARLRAQVSSSSSSSSSGSSSTSFSSSSSPSSLSSSSSSSSSSSAAGSPARGQLRAWVEYQNECESQGVTPSATMFAQWQAVQGIAPPPATPPARPAASRVSPVAEYPAIGGQLPPSPVALSPLSVSSFGGVPLQRVLPSVGPFGQAPYGHQPGPAPQQQADFQQQLLALLGTQLAYGSGGKPRR